MGAEGRRANYGCSPGDEHSAAPYASVGPWTAEVRGALWNAATFRGAELTYAKLLEAPDPHAAALMFLTTRTDALDELASRARHRRAARRTGHDGGRRPSRSWTSPCARAWLPGMP
jgi:hypothetical protein